MSIETDVAEVKAILQSLSNRIDENIEYSKTICILKHKTVDEHLKDSPIFRDRISRLSGQMMVVLSILSIVLVGVLSIAWFVIQKVVQ